MKYPSYSCTLFMCKGCRYVQKDERKNKLQNRIIIYCPNRICIIFYPLYFVTITEQIFSIIDKEFIWNIAIFTIKQNILGSMTTPHSQLSNDHVKIAKRKTKQLRDAAERAQRHCLLILYYQKPNIQSSSRILNNILLCKIIKNSLFIYWLNNLLRKYFFHLSNIKSNIISFSKHKYVQYLIDEK